MSKDDWLVQFPCTNCTNFFTVTNPTDKASVVCDVCGAEYTLSVEVTQMARATPTYSREKLIDLCVRATVPQGKWTDRDSADAQLQVGQAWALLRAGCPFTLRYDKEPHGLCTNPTTIWVEIEYEGFKWFEYGDREKKTFYIPTEMRLEEADGNDWC